MKYLVESPGRFFDCGEESSVYFDPQTGNTHLISSFAAHLLQTLTEQSMDSNELIEQISPGIETEDLAEVAKAVPGILAELIALEIVGLA